MSKSFTTMHLNTSVYELVETKDGESQALFKQRNNPILVKGLMVERRIDSSWEDVENELTEMFKTEMLGFGMYPMEKFSRGQKMNMTVAYGWMVEYERPDPDKPISVMLNDGEDDVAAIDKAREEALKWKPTVKPFFFQLVLSF